MNNMNYKKIAVARRTGDRKKLFESSLSRILDHVDNSTKRSFAILTSWRQSNTKKENLIGIKKLKSAIRSHGLGFIPIRGHWRECQDPEISYKDCPEGDLVDASEPSLFVIGLTMEQATALGNLNKQDAIVFAGPETNGDVKLLFSDGESMNLGPYAANTVGEAYSELISSKLAAPKSFKFEGLECTARSFIESLIDEHVQKIILNIIK